MTTQILESGNHCKPRFSNGSMMWLIPLMRYQYVGSTGWSLSYSKLQPPPLCLTVLKLDGSCFEIEVSRMGTVGELKRAVEEAFDDLPKEGPGRVSWEHVWGQFCLCHEGEMLLTDTDHISMLGMKDGDQLQFIRRALSSDNSTEIKLNGADTEEEDEPHKDKHKNHEKEDSMDWDLGADDDGDGVSRRNHRLSLLLTGLFPYHKLSSSMRVDRGCSSRSSSNILGSFKNSGSKYDSGILT